MGQRLANRKEGVGGVEGRGRLRHEGAVGREQLLDASVEVVAVETVQVRMVGIGQIGDHDVELPAGRPQAFHFDEGVRREHFYPRIAEGVRVQRSERFREPIRRVVVLAAEEAQQLRIDVDQRHRHGVPPQHVAQRQSIAAAENQHALAAIRRQHGRRGEVGVVDAFVVGGELQRAVDVEAQHVRLASGHMALRQHDVLKRRLQAVDHPVLEQRVAEIRDPPRAEHGQHHQQPGQQAVADPQPMRWA